MGNGPCASENVSQPPGEFKIDRNDTNTTFEDDYSLNNSPNPKSAEKPQIIQIRSLGVLKGSKQLQFGFMNTPNQPKSKTSIRSICTKEKMPEKNESKTHLQPIIFSIIGFSVSSNGSQQARSQNGSWVTSLEPNKLLSSTREEESDSSNAQKAAFDYILNFVDWTPSVEVSKEQFIRIKKINIENDYQLKQKMGEGSFGQVYRCLHRQTGELRAVKLLKRNLFINPRIKQQFMQEFSVLKKVDHPHILKIFQIYETRNNISIVSEFCSGNSLASYIKKKVVFSPQTKMEILRQLFLGVNYLHHMKITHRDLKPDNIVFINQMSESTTPEEVDLRIIDFGLAIEQKEPVFKDWANIGTYNFMAPEAYEGVYSNKCDSWACGVIMYVLLLGFNPYRGYEIEEVKKKVRFYSPRISDFKHLQLQAIELILRLTKVNYVMRWTMSQALNSPYFTHNQHKIDKNDVFARISTYRSKNSLVAAIERYLSFKKTNQFEQSKIGRYFHSINTNKNGTINLQQFSIFFEDVQKEEIQRFFKRIDKNHSGTIDFGQFSAAISSKGQLFTLQNLREVFDVIDINSSGKLTKQQIKYFLRSLDKASVGDLISEISTEKNNFITFQEFSSYILKDKWF